MPRQNRVTPYGELIAVPDRGMFWGNRGPLLDREGRLARYSRGQAWAICVLSFKGRRRQQWTPGRLTELYFLDEATGLAAGHRPCGECRYHEYQAFKRAWARSVSANRGGVPGVKEIDARLHADRLAGPGVRRTYQAPRPGRAGSRPVSRPAAGRRAQARVPRRYPPWSRTGAQPAAPGTCAAGPSRRAGQRAAVRRSPGRRRASRRRGPRRA